MIRSTPPLMLTLPVTAAAPLRTVGPGPLKNMLVPGDSSLMLPASCSEAPPATPTVRSPASNTGAEIVWLPAVTVIEPPADVPKVRFPPLPPCASV